MVREVIRHHEDIKAEYDEARALKRTLGECQAPASSVVRPTDAALIPLSEP